MRNPPPGNQAQLRWRLYRPVQREASRAWGTTARGILLFCVTLAMVGCEAPKVTPALPVAAANPKPTNFDPATARSISGRVLWHGSLPQAPVFDIMPNPLSGTVLQKRQQRPNPNLPVVDPVSHGVSDAVVFLRGVDPALARPWDHPPVCVEQKDCQIKVVQGDMSSGIGFVRQGDEIEMVSHDPWLHALHVDGPSFFTLMFPDPERALRRKLGTPGVIELSSNAGYFWMRGYLFVGEHPYYCRTGRDGAFELRGVPAGTYQLVAWHPNWQVARKELDPESGLTSRISFARPFEVEESITLTDLDRSDLKLELPSR